MRRKPLRKSEYEVLMITVFSLIVGHPGKDYWDAGSMSILLVMLCLDTCKSWQLCIVAFLTERIKYIENAMDKIFPD